MASSPDITSRCSLNPGGTLNNNNTNTANNNHHGGSGHHAGAHGPKGGSGNNNNNNNGPVAMSETSDDSSLNSVDLDPMGKFEVMARIKPIERARLVKTNNNG